MPSIEEKLHHLDKNELLKQIISVEFNRFLAFYKNAPDIKITSSKRENKKIDKRKKDKYKQEKNRKKDKYKQEKSDIGKAEKGYSRFFMNIGKKQNLKSHDLIGLINEATRKRNIPIGKIDIMRKFSFFEVKSDFEKDILNSFTDRYFNGHSLNVEISQAPKLNEISKTYRKTKKSSFKKNKKSRRRK